MDPLGLKDAQEELRTKTLPELLAIGQALVCDLNRIVDRLDGATITIKLKEQENVPKITIGVESLPCHDGTGGGPNTNPNRSDS
jgi:hypothetical protein